MQLREGMLRRNRGARIHAGPRRPGVRRFAVTPHPRIWAGSASQWQHPTGPHAPPAHPARCLRRWLQVAARGVRYRAIGADLASGSGSATRLGNREAGVGLLANAVVPIRDAVATANRRRIGLADCRPGHAHARGGLAALHLARPAHTICVGSATRRTAAAIARSAQLIRSPPAARSGAGAGGQRAAAARTRALRVRSRFAAVRPNRCARERCRSAGAPQVRQLEHGNLAPVTGVRE